MTQTSIVELQGVTVGYDRHAVLAGLDLRIARGTFAALIGANGSGKTTLLKTIAGILPPRAGTVTFHPPAVLGYVPQRDQLDSVFLFSAFEVALMGVCGRVGAGRRIGRTERERVQDCLRQTGADGFARERFAELSGGQKQRVLIARAFYRNPEFLFLDEATSALDANNESTILTHLRQYVQGRTVVVIAHRLSTVRDADQIVVVHGGRIVETGRHDELVARGGAAPLPCGASPV